MAPLAGAAVASCMILLLLLVPCAQGQGQPPEAPEEAWAERQPPEASEDALTLLLSEGGCGAFAGLVAAMAGVGDAFREQIGSDLGLTILCPDDEAVWPFIPRFHSLTVDEQVAVLLYHGLTMAYSEELLSQVHWEWEVLTFDGEQTLTIRHYRGRAILSPWPPSSRNEARITKTVVDDDHLAVYLIDAVLIPTELKSVSLFWAVVVPFLLVAVGIALFLLFHALVYLCSLVCQLTRWCKARAAAYASAARVTPHGQGQQQEH
ncbi:unnamed protein product [Triticum aestivum]|uniref:FAS1 domain-containing protein n=6 Tax=Triticinae TaxID=1648030 RepID=A0A9R1ERH0_WHEAT|nr:fasciclin-like arabinogalactan protein 2 [Aegilops tauschii subsp. strangulata]XP_044327967.1 fasciclin-like arabinogalactan protein 2 [Triticum aestivum]KAF7014924.1 hypothetical protein CFC21_028849 [Triticum aestivum]SPT17066.1 unnamed protein product [Triticum aestivum]